MYGACAVLVRCVFTVSYGANRLLWGTLPASSGGGGDVVSVVALQTTQSTSLWKPTVKLRNLLCTGSCVLFFDSLYGYETRIINTNNNTSNVDTTKDWIRGVLYCAGNKNVGFDYNAMSSPASSSSSSIIVGIDNTTNINRQNCYDLSSPSSSLSYTSTGIGGVIRLRPHHYNNQKVKFNCSNSLSSASSMLLLSSLSSSNTSKNNEKSIVEIVINRTDCNDTKCIDCNGNKTSSVHIVAFICIDCNCIDCNDNINCIDYNGIKIGFIDTIIVSVTYNISSSSSSSQLLPSSSSINTSTKIVAVIQRRQHRYSSLLSINSTRIYDSNSNVDDVTAYIIIDTTSDTKLGFFLISSVNNTNDYPGIVCNEWNDDKNHVQIVIINYIGRNDNGISSDYGGTSIGVGGVHGPEHVRRIIFTSNVRRIIVTSDIDTNDCIGFIRRVIVRSNVIRSNVDTNDCVSTIVTSTIDTYGCIIVTSNVTVTSKSVRRIIVPRNVDTDDCICVTVPSSNISSMHIDDVIGSSRIGMCIIDYTNTNTSTINVDTSMIDSNDSNTSRRLLQVVYRCGIHDTCRVEDTIRSIVTIGRLLKLVYGCDIKDTRDVEDTIRSIVTSYIDTSSNDNDTNSGVIVTSNSGTSSDVNETTNSSVIVTGCGIHDTSIAVDAIRSITDDAISSTVPSNIDTSSEANDTNSSVIVTGCGIHDTSIAVDAIHDTSIAVDAISSTVTSNINTSSIITTNIDTNGCIIVMSNGNNTVNDIDSSIIITSKIDTNYCIGFIQRILATINVDTNDCTSKSVRRIIVTSNIAIFNDCISFIQRIIVTSNVDTNDCIYDVNKTTTSCVLGYDCSHRNIHTSSSIISMSNIDTSAVNDTKYNTSYRNDSNSFIIRYCVISGIIVGINDNNINCYYCSKLLSLLSSTRRQQVCCERVRNKYSDCNGSSLEILLSSPWINFVVIGRDENILLLVVTSLFPQVWIYLYVIAILHNIVDPCLVSRNGFFPSSMSVDSMISVGGTRIGGANNIVVFICTVTVPIVTVQIISSLSFASLLLSGNTSIIGSTVVIGYDDTSSNNTDHDYNYWLPSLFPPVVFDIHVIAFLHYILYSFLVSSEYILPSRIDVATVLSQSFQTEICVSVNTFLHNIFDSLLVSSDDISLSIVLATALSQFLFQVKTCIYFVAILHIMFNPTWVLVWFAPGSFASLSCNPYLGSLGCVRCLRVHHQGEAIVTGFIMLRRLHHQEETIVTRFIVLHQLVYRSRLTVTSNANTRGVNETTNNSVIVTSISIISTRNIDTRHAVIVTSVIVASIIITGTRNINTSDVDETTNSSVIGTSVIVTSSNIISTSNTDTSDINETTISSVICYDCSSIIITRDIFISDDKNTNIGIIVTNLNTCDGNDSNSCIIGYFAVLCRLIVTSKVDTSYVNEATNKSSSTMKMLLLRVLASQVVSLSIQETSITSIQVTSTTQIVVLLLRTTSMICLESHINIATGNVDNCDCNCYSTSLLLSSRHINDYITRIIIVTRSIIDRNCYAPPLLVLSRRINKSDGIVGIIINHADCYDINCIDCNCYSPSLPSSTRHINNNIDHHCFSPLVLSSSRHINKNDSIIGSIAYHIDYNDDKNHDNSTVRIINDKNIDWDYCYELLSSIIGINNRNINRYYCYTWLSSSLSSTISVIIVGNNDPLYSYGLSSSLQSTRSFLSGIIVGNNDCYCYGLSSFLSSTFWIIIGIIVGSNDCYVINTNSIDCYYCDEFFLSNHDDVYGSWSQFSSFLLMIGSVCCTSSIKNNVSYNDDNHKKRKVGSMLSLSLLPIINQDNNHPSLVSSDDTFSSSTLSSCMFLLSQVWIYLYVIAILHNVLEPCLVSRGDIFSTRSFPSTLSLSSRVMISIHGIASLHNVVDSVSESSGDNSTSSLLSLIMLKLFQANQRSLLVLRLLSFLQLVCYNDSVIDWSIIGINTSDDNATITVTSKIDYMTIKRNIFTQDNNHMDDIPLLVLLSLLSQVWIYIHVTAILQHSILDPCFVSSGDFSPPSILSSIVYLLFQVRICMHVIAILHNILYSLLESRVDTCTLSPLSLMVLQPFQPNQCYHGRSFLNPLMGSSVFPEIFDSWSFKSLFCNPYLGSRWCVRLQQGVTKISTQDIMKLPKQKENIDPGTFRLIYGGGIKTGGMLPRFPEGHTILPFLR